MVKGKVAIQHKLLAEANNGGSISAQKRIASRIEEMNKEIVSCHNHQHPDQPMSLKDLQPPSVAFFDEQKPKKNADPPANAGQKQRSDKKAPENKAQTANLGSQGLQEQQTDPQTIRQQQMKMELVGKMLLAPEKLREIHHRLLEYVFLREYRQTLGLSFPPQIIGVLESYLPLLKNYCKVTPLHRKQVLQKLPLITYEDVLGQSLEQRNATLNTLEMRANQDIAILESLGFTEDSDLLHSTSLRDHIREIRSNPLTPAPKVEQVQIKRPSAPQIENAFSVPDKTLRVLITGVEGSVIDSRHLYLMLNFNHLGKVIKVKTPLVSIFDKKLTLGGTFKFCYDFAIPEPTDKEFSKGFVLLQLFKKKILVGDILSGSGLISLSDLCSQNRVEGKSEFYYKNKGLTIQINVEKH